MTKIDIFSGFLGAGKTTLIKKMIAESYKGQKLVLIENEFGEISIDGGFLKESGVQISEMSAGCICCSLVGDFHKALKDVQAQFHPDRILIEPSGVGKLSDVIVAVQNTADETDDMKLNSFVTVADATKVKVYMKNFGEFYNNQIETASTIILSRTDSIPQSKLDASVAMLREHNSVATIVTTPWGELTGEPDGSGAMLHSFRYYGVPETYRILMVTASGETFLSDVLTRRTLQSSVTVDWTAKTAKPPLQSVGYLLQFAATFVPTILIELVVLLLFGFKLKENWKPFLLVNLVTQGLLHGYFALFAVNNGVGPGYFMLFFPAELVIALLEAFIYRAALRGRSKRRAFLCGLCANVCSAALGFFLAEPVWQFVVSIS